jgi:deoxyadenosine/deoxycytidine kinase
MHNIRTRNRDFERSMTEEYIRALNEAYNRFFFNYTDSPLLIINATKIDFVNNKQDFEELLKQIQRPISGTDYYSPAK